MRRLSWIMWVLSAAGSSGCLDQLLPGPQGEHQLAAAPDPVPSTSVDGGAAEDLAPAGPDLAPGSLAPDMTFVQQLLTFEAEGATLSGGMTAADDGNASGGKVVTLAIDATDGKAVFAVSIPSSGTYAVWGRVISPTDANNSFHFSLDNDAVDNDASDATSTIWDLPLTTAFTWSRVNMRTDVGNTDLTPMLSAGAHTIFLNFREPGVTIDRLLVTNDLAFKPQ